ncbi:MAG: SurA N-terminal domain-containing protein [Candidatus Tectomicrobia bacterium]|nr:SurA N-terminal domain-containing protein [Candidatus Tectomicrobia bacterium]
MKKRESEVLWMITAVLFITLLAQGAEAMVIDRIVAKVNREIITMSDLEERLAILANQQGGLPDGDTTEIKKSLLDRMIDQKLILQKAKELGLTVSSQELSAAVQETLEGIKKQNNITSDEQFEQALLRQGLTLDKYRKEVEEQISIQLYESKVISLEVRSKIQITENDISNYYYTHPKEFLLSEEVRLRHIFFRYPPGASEGVKVGVREKALGVLRRLRAGEDFATLAAQYSDGPRTDGGDLGFVKKGAILPVLEEIAFNLPSGQISCRIGSGCENADSPVSLWPSRGGERRQRLCPTASAHLARPESGPPSIPDGWP